jgi:pterin-4a-carbinolamine dehydratase
METANTTTSQDPASVPITRETEFVGKQYANGLQFEEAVQRLTEEFDRHPEPPKGIFY